MSIIIKLLQCFYKYIMGIIINYIIVFFYKCYCCMFTVFHNGIFIFRIYAFELIKYPWDNKKNK